MCSEFTATDGKKGGVRLSVKVDLFGDIFMEAVLLFQLYFKGSVGILLSYVIKFYYRDKCLAVVMSSQMLEVTCFIC